MSFPSNYSSVSSFLCDFHSSHKSHLVGLETLLRDIQAISEHKQSRSVTYIVFNSTTHMERAIALHTTAGHATTICTLAEATPFMPPFIWDVEIVNIVTTVRILKKNYEWTYKLITTFRNPQCAIHMSPLEVCSSFHRPTSPPTKNTLLWINLI